MSPKTITTVRFQNYWKLLKRTKPSLEMVIIFNEQASFLWQSARKLHPQMSMISEKVKTYLDRGDILQMAPKIEPMEHQQQLEIMPVIDDNIDEKLLVAFVVDTVTDTQPGAGADTAEAIKLLNNSLLTEYVLIRRIIEKEQELNDMAEELTHRYEELNLIYTSEDQVQNLSHGRELLKHIVNNACTHLEVDLAIILLPEKSINVMQSRQAIPPEHYNLILQTLVKEIYLYLKVHKTSLVLNKQQDALHLNIIIDLPYKYMVTPITNPDNEVIGMMAIINRSRRTDYTNSDRNLLEVLTNKAANIVLRNFDSLTGLENKHSFELIVMDTLKESWRNDSYHAIANIDIDRMAVINDISGHDAGDNLIKTVGMTISKKVRSCDTVARLDSDKFAVLLKNCGLEKARQIMQKIADDVSKLKIIWNDDVHEVSVSVGIAPITADIQNLSSILTNAESARIAAKDHGRNQIQVLNLDDKDLITRKEQIKWVSRTQAAIRENRLELFAQLISPMIPDDQLPHFEILVRMRDPKGQIVPPGMFLPAAEKFFLMPKLDRWVISNTFHQLSKQIEKNGKASCQVSINLSGQSLTERNLAEYISKSLSRYQIDPKLLCFEITESAAIANIEEAREFIAIIRKMGCKVSLDDFGTGHSSFAYLRTFEVDYLKIDGSFIRNVDTDLVLQSMVSAINQVSHSMELKTIAEYVENAEVLQRLRELDIDYAQGYGINKPQPFDEQVANLQAQADS